MIVRRGPSVVGGGIGGQNLPVRSSLAEEREIRTCWAINTLLQKTY